MLGIILGILSLSIIILIHEFGHFIFAKLFGVGVLEFSLGMGPRIISFVKNNTRYSWKAIPLGGSCAMLGEDAAGSGDFTEYGAKVDNEKGTIDFDGVVYKKDEIESKSINKKSPLQKMIITFSGPLFNFLLAFILIIPIVAFTGADLPIIGSVAENSAASQAQPYALEAGDKIIGMQTGNDKTGISFYREVLLFMQLHASDFDEKNDLLLITFERDGKKLKTLLQPKYDEEYKRSLIGVTFNNEIKKPSSISELLDFSFKEFRWNTYAVVRGLRMLVTGAVGMQDMSGPIGTVAFMGESIETAKSYSLFSMLFTIAQLIILISINLGIMNLLPIPALDGGRILLYAIEMITGRPIDQRIEGIVNGAGMIFLLILMALILGNDIFKLFIR